MRTAILFTGLSRSLELGFLFHKHYIIEPLKADVFLHTWDVSNGGCRFIKDNNALSTGRLPFTTREIEQPCFSKSVEDFISQDMNCKRYQIESYSEFEKKYGNNTTAAMTYSWKGANELKKQWEKENNFKYDLVIKTRLDLLPHVPIPKLELEDYQHKIFLGQNYDKEYLKTRPFTTPDSFAFSSSELIDVYCEAFDTWLTNTSYRNESLLEGHLLSRRIPYLQSSIKMKMMEVYTKNEWYAVHRTLN